MRSSKLKINSEKTFSDLDFLLINYSFASYVIIRFLFESGWLLGSIFSLSILFGLKRLSRARHTMYLYAILLFTSENEQKWLLRKFSLNSKIFSDLKQNKVIDNVQINDVLNKVIEVLWPFIKSYLEELIRKKISFLYQKMKSKRLQPIIQYLVDIKGEEINLGLQAPIIELIEVIPSRKIDVMVININFRYFGNGVLKFFTRLKNMRIKNIKMKGCLRAEVGPLLSTPPFIQGVKMFLTEEPQLDFSISDIPTKIEKLIKIISLERISEKLVMPNQICLSLRQDTKINCLPFGVIFIHVVEGRNLPNKEIFSESDPFCEVQLGSIKVSTKTIKRTLNPVWKFKTQMICFCDPKHGNLDVHFTIYDKDVILNDVLFRSKLSVRKIMEEKTVDEWLYNMVEEKDENPAKGRLYIQALWQDLSSAVPSLEMSEKRAKVTEKEMDVSSDAELSQYSNLGEMNSLTSCENFNRKDVEDFEKNSNGNLEFYKAILLVWVETAQKLEPSWEDFQIKLKFYDSVEKTSFVPRDLNNKWSYRQRFLFMIPHHENGEQNCLTLKIISKTNTKCIGHISFKIPNIIQEFTTDDNLNEFFLRNENKREFEASVKLAFLIKGIKPLSLESRILIQTPEKEEEITEEDITAITAPEQTFNNDEVSEEPKKKKSPKSHGIFSFSEASLSICSPFVRSNPLEIECEESEKQPAQKTQNFPLLNNADDDDSSSSTSRKTPATTNAEEPSDVSAKDVGSSLKRKDSKRASRWNMWKYGRKIKKETKHN